MTRSSAPGGLLSERAELSIDELKPAVQAIRSGRPKVLGERLGQLPRLCRARITGSDWMADDALVRAVMARARDAGLSRRKALEMLDLLRGHGATRRAFLTNFDEVFSGVERNDPVALVLAQWLSDPAAAGNTTIRKWAGETLCALFKDAVWDKWKHDGDEPKPRRFHYYRELRLNERNVRLLLNLGASRQAMPPEWHREQNTLTFYAIELGRPQLSSLVFSVGGGHHRVAQRRKRRPGRTTKATLEDRDRIIRFLSQADLDLENSIGPGVPTKEQLEHRLAGLMVEHFVPNLRPLEGAGADRESSMVGGLPFTSSKFPWLMDRGAPCAPLLQLDLAEISRVTGLVLGGGLLQVWRSVNQGVSNPRESAVRLRVIPESSRGSPHSMTAPPEMFVNCMGDPTYSWAHGALGNPHQVTGWRKAGLALPDLSESSGLGSWYPDVPGDLAALSAAVQRPDLGVSILGCPSIPGPYFQQPEGSRPLAILHGPLHGLDVRESELFVDRVEVYFALGSHGRVEFGARWLCGDQDWD